MQKYQITWLNKCPCEKSAYTIVHSKSPSTAFFENGDKCECPECHRTGVIVGSAKVIWGGA